MDKFTKLTGIAAPMPLVNIDTDMIIPKQFLKTIQRSGLGKNLFDEMRYTQDGQEIPDFVLNQPAYRSAQIPDAQHTGFFARWLSPKTLALIVIPVLLVSLLMLALNAQLESTAHAFRQSIGL